ncbi:MAG: six-hairpin glycosidase-like protein [Bacteroidota bacterium]
MKKCEIVMSYRFNSYPLVHGCSKLIVAIVCLLSTNNPVLGQQKIAEFQNEIFWKVNSANGITWNLANERRLPRDDRMEMDGQQVAAIVQYKVDRRKQVSVSRDVIFPQLRKFIKSTDQNSANYRAYLRDTYNDDLLPVINMAGRTFVPGVLDSICIQGKLTLYHHQRDGIRITRCFFPSMKSRLFVEKWVLTNTSDSVKHLKIGHTTLSQEEDGIYGLYKRKVYCDALKEVSINPGQNYEFAIYFSAHREGDVDEMETQTEAEKGRNNFLDSIHSKLILETPDSTINTLFYFSKIHAAESIYQSKIGLIHSPGGGTYYAGIWANDQGEYTAPLFPYLGYKTGNIAAMNAYRMFLRNIPKGDAKIWASFEMEGDLPCCSSDRGDAAMLSFGISHFLLASGNRQYAKELWPLIEWCVGYCEKMKTPDGVIASMSDELEGRFPSGTANLSTSCLYYGALRQLAVLGKAMGKDKKLIDEFTNHANQLALAIEKYFGSVVEGIETYKYYKENTTLRSWICLPLVMGIQNRKAGTLDALFTKLWTDNGVRIESNSGVEKGREVFWDRGTLYAFRGAFKAGAAERAIKKLEAFSTTRLKGFHVPYVVEAWPENGMAHLSAESALYCRIFTEGILGIVPTGFNSFTIQPHLPADWKKFSIKKIAAFNKNFDISIKTTAANEMEVTIDWPGGRINKKIANGEILAVNFDGR